MASSNRIASSLSYLIDNLAEEIKKNKCKDCNCFLEYASVNDNISVYLVIKII